MANGLVFTSDMMLYQMVICLGWIGKPLGDIPTNILTRGAFEDTYGMQYLK